VNRDESARSHVYQAAVSEDATQRRLVSDLLDRAFEGSALGLVMQALAARPASPEELRQIRALIDQMKKDGRV
jgi:predicted transcriptional regulator